MGSANYFGGTGPRTAHATARAQQRGIPPMIEQLLDLYGQEEHDGHGTVTLYLSKKSIRRMEQEFGRCVVSRLSPWLDAYKVQGADGKTITVGHRTRHIKRK